MKANGGVFNKIQFPTAFGKDGLIGVMATEDIDDGEVIILILNKIL